MLTASSSDLLARLDPGKRTEQYFDILLFTNQAINLVSRETSRADMARMTAECLLPFTIIKGLFEDYLDIGSGGGLPAIPILLTQQITGNATLIERTQKKARALQSITQQLGLSVSVIPQTFEDLHPADRFGLITLRYVKLTGHLLDNIALLLKQGGVFLYYSGTELKHTNLELTQHQFVIDDSSVSKGFTIFRKR